MPATDTLAQLAEAHAAFLAAERARLELVVAALNAGATWQQVADATGLKTRQEAQSKFKRHLVIEPAKVSVRETA